MVPTRRRSFVSSFPRFSGARVASGSLLAVAGLIAMLMSSSAQPMSPPLLPNTWYVDASQSANPQDGLAWATAFTNLHYPLNSYVQPGDRIFVREGTYVAPTNGFIVDTSVKIYGAFLGTEQSPETRVGSAAATILEGIVNQGTGERARHVVQVLGVSGNPGVLLDGFTIRNGNTLGGSVSNGGGIYALTSDLDLRDCTLRANVAQADGGGLYFDGGGEDVASNTLHIVSCLFDANLAVWNGGALAASLVKGDIVNCQFAENAAYLEGGAMSLQTMGDPNLLSVANCSFWKNSAGQAVYGTGHGGAVYLGESSATASHAANAEFANCTMADNKAYTCTDGQAIWVSTYSQSKIYSSILAFNDNGCSTGVPNPIGGTSAVEYTDFWPLGNYTLPIPNIHNKQVNPFFRSHSLTGLTLVGGSECIDAADYDRLPLDLHDLDGDGMGLEPLPLDLLFQKRTEDRSETDTGHATDGIHTFLDMGAYEKP